MASAALKVSVPFGQLGPLLLKLGTRAEGAYKRGLLSAAMRARTIMDAAVKTAPPASPRGSVGAFNTGYYARAWKVERTENGVHIYNLAPYAGVIEYGRRPGARPPPKKVMVKYAQRKLGLSAKEARRVGFLMARAIGRRGLAPRRVLTGPSTVSFLIACLRDSVQNEILAEWRKP